MISLITKMSLLLYFATISINLRSKEIKADDKTSLQAFVQGIGHQHHSHRENSQQLLTAKIIEIYNSAYVEFKIEGKNVDIKALSQVPLLEYLKSLVKDSEDPETLIRLQEAWNEALSKVPDLVIEGLQFALDHKNNMTPYLIGVDSGSRFAAHDFIQKALESNEKHYFHAIDLSKKNDSTIDIFQTAVIRFHALKIRPVHSSFATFGQIDVSTKSKTELIVAFIKSIAVEEGTYITQIKIASPDGATLHVSD